MNLAGPREELGGELSSLTPPSTKPFDAPPTPDRGGGLLLYRLLQQAVATDLHPFRELTITASLDRYLCRDARDERGPESSACHRDLGDEFRPTGPYIPPEACASRVSLGPATGRARLWRFPWES